MKTSELAFRNRALDYYRRLVALIYREIGVLKASNHPDIAAKAKLTEGFFGVERKERARQLYRLSVTDTSPDTIAARYVKHTGLSLDDVREAFEAGSWRNASGGFSFGGPKWAAITRAAIQLGAAIRENSSRDIEALLHTIDELEHNTGRMVAKFRQLDT